MEPENGATYYKKGFGVNNITEGIVVCGWRHLNCMQIFAALTGKKTVPVSCGQFITGFLTDKNRFVDRKEGKVIALQSGQITEQHGGTLFSEDLW